MNTVIHGLDSESTLILCYEKSFAGLAYNFYFSRIKLA
jgi:hypothetical protein